MRVPGFNNGRLLLHLVMLSVCALLASCFSKGYPTEIYIYPKTFQVEKFYPLFKEFLKENKVSGLKVIKYPFDVGSKPSQEYVFTMRGAKYYVFISEGENRLWIYCSKSIPVPESAKEVPPILLLEQLKEKLEEQNLRPERDFIIEEFSREQGASDDFYLHIKTTQRGY
jgi:hypothetical protein